MRAVTTFVTLFALGTPAVRASSVTDCVQPATHTADRMAECLHGVGTEAEARLNATYARVLAALDPESGRLLREAQRHWVAFREAEVRAQAGPWRSSRNLARRIDATVAIIAAVDERERELRLYLPD